MASLCCTSRACVGVRRACVCWSSAAGRSVVDDKAGTGVREVGNQASKNEILAAVGALGYTKAQMVQVL